METTANTHKKRSRSDQSSSSSNNSQHVTPFRKTVKLSKDSAGNLYDCLMGSVSSDDEPYNNNKDSSDTPKITAHFSTVNIKDKTKPTEEEPPWLANQNKQISDQMEVLFKRHEQHITTIFNKKIDDLIASNQFLQQELTSAHITITANQNKLDYLQETVNKQKQQIEKQEQKMEDSENYSKKYNLKLYGVEEKTNESQLDLLHALGTILDNMGLEKQRVTIDNIHRLPSKGKGPRPIIIRFVTILAKNYIWENRSSLRGSPFILREHFSKKIESNIRTLLPIRKAALNLNMRAQLSADKLRINGQLYTVSNLNTLPSNLNPQKLSTHTKDNHLFFFSSACPLSNHHPSPFTLDKITYSTNEEYIQTKKAKLFNDKIALHNIQNSITPGEMKYHASKISNFDRHLWETQIEEIATIGNRAKFSQNPDLKKFLIETKTLTLVETNPNDSLWGIGMSLHDAKLIEKKKSWGKNLQGETLMKLRKEFIST